jgi:hypothetical protein
MNIIGKAWLNLYLVDTARQKLITITDGLNRGVATVNAPLPCPLKTWKM